MRRNGNIIEARSYCAIDEDALSEAVKKVNADSDGVNIFKRDVLLEMTPERLTEAIACGEVDCEDNNIDFGEFTRLVIGELR